jgi:hypothetical protein
MAALTAGQLIEQLKAANPDMPVVVECERRCDPHPIDEVHVVVRTETEDMVRPAHVRLIQNVYEDFEVRQEKAEADGD